MLDKVGFQALVEETIAGDRERMRPFGSGPLRLWERILADNAEAKFIVAGRRETREGDARY